MIGGRTCECIFCKVLKFMYAALPSPLRTSHGYVIPLYRCRTNREIHIMVRRGHSWKQCLSPIAIATTKWIGEGPHLFPVRQWGAPPTGGDYRRGMGDVSSLRIALNKVKLSNKGWFAAVMQWDAELWPLIYTELEVKFALLD